MKTAVPITKNLLRTRVMNSRRAIRYVVWRASPSAARSGRRGGRFLTHRLAKDLEQARDAAPELAHRTGRDGRAQHRLVVGPAIELHEDARPVATDRLHPAQAAGPAVRRLRRVDPELDRAVAAQLVDGARRDQVAALDDPDPVADPLHQVE